MSSARELRVVLLGKTGAGKSSLGNTLMGRKVFRVECSFSSVTFRCQWAAAVRGDVALKVTDTPGVSDTNRNEDEVLKEVGKSVAVASPGPHVVLMVLRCGRFTNEEYQAYVTLKGLFGEDIKKFLIVVFTHADGLEGATAEEREASLRTALSSAPDHLREVVEDAGGRYFASDNRASLPDRDRETQAQELLAMMQELVSRNQGAFFTNKLCEEVNTRVDTLVQRRVQTEHVTPEMAAAVTRQAIVDDKEDPGFFQELGKIMKRALLPVVIGVMGTVGGMVVKAAAARLAGCSVM